MISTDTSENQIIGFVKWCLKWLAIVAGGLIVLVAVIGVGAWGYDRYKERPRQVTSFADVELGMTPTDVKIILGAPRSEKSDSEKIETILRYNDYYNDRIDIFLLFKGDGKENYSLRLICDLSWPRLFGITSSSSMGDVLRRLGSPTSERINEDKLSKLLIYENWNARFLIKRNKVQGICVGTS